jgi:hypothetical protein
MQLVIDMILHIDSPFHHNLINVISILNIPNKHSILPSPNPPQSSTEYIRLGGQIIQVLFG